MTGVITKVALSALLQLFRDHRYSILWNKNTSTTEIARTSLLRTKTTHLMKTFTKPKRKEKEEKWKERKKKRRKTKHLCMHMHSCIHFC